MSEIDLLTATLISICWALMFPLGILFIFCLFYYYFIGAWDHLFLSISKSFTQTASKTGQLKQRKKWRNSLMLLLLTPHNQVLLIFPLPIINKFPHQYDTPFYLNHFLSKTHIYKIIKKLYSCRYWNIINTRYTKIRINCKPNNYSHPTNS